VFSILKGFQSWRLARVRAIGRGDTYIRFSPNFGFSLPWFGRRLRWAWHHGLQLVAWRADRWVVTRQLLGTSKVKGERPGGGS